MNKEKFYHLPLNLQQGIIHTNGNYVNTVCAFYQKHRKLVVIRPEYRDDTRTILDLIDNYMDVSTIVLKYGDGFGIDTWDKITEQDF